jgi:hypothetical protein
VFKYCGGFRYYTDFALRMPQLRGELQKIFIKAAAPPLRAARYIDLFLRKVLFSKTGLRGLGLGAWSAGSKPELPFLGYDAAHRVYDDLSRVSTFSSSGDPFLLMFAESVEKRVVPGSLSAAYVVLLHQPLMTLTSRSL